MATLSFKCPECHLHCICRVTRSDYLFALTSFVPVPLVCWSCGTDILVIQKDKAIPPNGARDTMVAHCLRIAKVCQQRALGAQTPANRMFFHGLEQMWLRLSQQVDREHQAVLVGASISGSPTFEPKLTA